GEAKLRRLVRPRRRDNARDIGAKQSFVASPGHDVLWTSTTTPNQKSRHHRACPGDPRLSYRSKPERGCPGHLARRRASRLSPGMTERVAGTSARSKASSSRPGMTQRGTSPAMTTEWP